MGLAKVSIAIGGQMFFDIVNYVVNSKQKSSMGMRWIDVMKLNDGQCRRSKPVRKWAGYTINSHQTKKVQQFKSGDSILVRNNSDNKMVAGIIICQLSPYLYHWLNKT